VVEALAEELIDLGEAELAAHLPMVTGRTDRGVGVVERLAADALRRGHAGRVRELVERVPGPSRSFELELLAAAAALGLSVVASEAGDCASLATLQRLVATARSHGEGAELRARALLASQLRLAGDPRLFDWCSAALGRDLGDPPDPASAPPDWLISNGATPHERWAAAELARFAGQALVLAGGGQVVARGRRLVGIALDLLDRAGWDSTSQRAWWAYMEVILYVRDIDEVIPLVRLAAYQLAAAEHHDGAVRLAELATLEYFADQPGRCRRTIEHAREASAATGNSISLAVLDAIQTALDATSEVSAAAAGERIDAVAARLRADGRLAPFEPFVFAELGVTLVGLGDVAAAERMLAAPSLRSTPRSTRPRRGCAAGGLPPWSLRRGTRAMVGRSWSAFAPTPSPRDATGW